MHPVLRGFFGILAAVYAYAAFLQLNDTDPLMWIAIYSVAAGLCGLAAVNNPAPATFNTVVIVSALVWAAYLANQVWGNGVVTPMFANQRMTGNLMIDTKEGRETGGLLIVAAGLALMVGVQAYSRYRPVHARDRRRQNLR